eukprot:scaffold9857_cov127-Cylindrotheca_fusiformis.AAC.7
MLLFDPVDLSKIAKRGVARCPSSCPLLGLRRSEMGTDSVPRPICKGRMKPLPHRVRRDGMQKQSREC